MGVEPQLQEAIDGQDAHRGVFHLDARGELGFGNLPRMSVVQAHGPVDLGCALRGASHSGSTLPAAKMLFFSTPGSQPSAGPKITGCTP